jgi:flagellum-specific peptidoglycan hydrolase FlgJ
MALSIKNFKTKNLLIGSAILLVILVTTKKTVNKYIVKMSEQDFIKFMYPYVKILGDKIGVPPIFLLSQIILETNYGKSSLFTKYFNVGGVKATKGQTFITLPTVEYIKGVKTKVNANFATYKDLTSGLIGYSKIFQNKYFKQYLNKTTNPDQYITLLQSGSPKYATDINYVTKIQSLNKKVSDLI